MSPPPIDPNQRYWDDYRTNGTRPRESRPTETITKPGPTPAPIGPVQKERGASEPEDWDYSSPALRDPTRSLAWIRDPDRERRKGKRMEDITGETRPMTRLLSAFDAPATDRVWLVGAHGGAGCTVIYRSDPGFWADAGRALPVSRDPSRPSRILLCAMGTSRGLEALQAMLNDANAGRFAPSILVGVAVTTPSRFTPLVLERSRRQVCSIAPVAVRLPWIGSIMVDGFPGHWPRAYHRLREQCERTAG